MGESRASFQVYSIFNNISMGRWGRVEPPFNYTLSLTISPWVDERRVEPPFNCTLSLIISPWVDEASLYLQQYLHG
jgi:hypothetical protein